MNPNNIREGELVDEIANTFRPLKCDVCGTDVWPDFSDPEGIYHDPAGHVLRFYYDESARSLVVSDILEM